jgi:hypothetical protein
MTSMTPNVDARPGSPDYCPWQHLGQIGDVSLTYHDDRPEMGLTDFTKRQVSLRAGMTPRERSSTLAHELVHIDRGAAYQGSAADADEVIVSLTAALRQIPAPVLEDLPELVERFGPEAACAFLFIDRWTLRDALLAVRLQAIRETDRSTLKAVADRAARRRSQA